MITCSRLGMHGRLGNQLWQIASTAGVAQTMGQSVGFFGWDYRAYFNVPDEFFPQDIMSRHPTQAMDSLLVSHIDVRARDYLQDYGLWKTIAPQVWSWFQPSPLALDKLKSYEWFFELPNPILSVHVRRGDNANSPNNSHPLRPTSYYIEAIEGLKGEFESIVFFSDDPEWCRTTFGGYTVEYDTAFFVGTPRPKEHEHAYHTAPILDWIDLQMMSRCDRHIISNSTYSWWGAFLSHDESPVYPWPFFGSDLDYIDTSLMFPDAWIRHDHGQQYVA